jgi:hypothetical protein
LKRALPLLLKLSLEQFFQRLAKVLQEMPAVRHLSGCASAFS